MSFKLSSRSINRLGGIDAGLITRVNTRASKAHRGEN